MGLNVGGIHVQVTEGVTQQKVTDAIKAYWIKNGAEPGDIDPLTIPPLSLKENGNLGLVILPPLYDASHSQWIPVYDSERYSADSNLAKYLSTQLQTRVWYWEITETSDVAYARLYGNKKKALQDNAVYNKIEALPAAFIYYNHFNREVSEELKSKCNFLGFKNIPHRPGSAYSGPSDEKLESNERKKKAGILVEKQNVKGLLALASDVNVYFDVIKPAVKYLDFTNKANVKFVCGLGPKIIKKSGANRYIAEAALRQGNEPLFKKAMEDMPSYALDLFSSAASEIGLNGEPLIAFRIMEAITRTGQANQITWNNTVYYLLQVIDQPDIPEKHLNQLLKGAEIEGKTNPGIFYNLACYYALTGKKEKVFPAIKNAVKYGYSDLDKMRQDSDFDSIREDNRFSAAFEVKELAGIENLIIERGYQDTKTRLVAPAISLCLYFDDMNAAPQLSALLSTLRDDFPQMFSYCSPSGYCGMNAVKKGKVTRDINALNKNKFEYGIRINYDSCQGEACEQRFYLDLHKKRGGELLIFLPLKLADNPDALYERLKRYVTKLPFKWGNAGFTLAPFDEGPVVGCGTDAEAELKRLLKDRIGLSVSPSQIGYLPHNDFIIPGWLTFMGPQFLERLSDDLENLVAPATCETLHAGYAVIRANDSPFVGNRTNLSDLGAFKQVVNALAPLLPKYDREGTFKAFMLERLSIIKNS